MSVRTSAKCAALLALTLTGCFKPPYNNFQPDNRPSERVAASTAMGIGAGAIVGALAGSTAIGAGIGGIAGAGIGLYKNSKPALIRALQQQDIEFIKYGDTKTLIMPTDKYYIFDTPKLNPICFEGLVNIIKLLKSYPCSTVYVAGFTDDVGSRYHKKMLSQARAETMLTFLWANGIRAQLLHAEGYGDKHAVGDNHLIRGSAYNRRIEIQWFKCTTQAEEPTPYIGATK